MPLCTFSLSFLVISKGFYTLTDSRTDHPRTHSKAVLSFAMDIREDHTEFYGLGLESSHIKSSLTITALKTTTSLGLSLHAQNSNSPTSGTSSISCQVLSYRPNATGGSTAREMY